MSFNYIPATEIIGDFASIPVLGEKNYCKLYFDPKEDSDTFLKKATQSDQPRPFRHVKVYPDQKHAVIYSESEGVLPVLEICVYKVVCKMSGIKYYMVCPCYEYIHYEQIKDVICLPYNQFNILKFVKDFILPFSNAKIEDI